MKKAAPLIAAPPLIHVIAEMFVLIDFLIFSINNLFVGIGL